ncbi:MAG TPA: hypothetical protein VFG73_05100 [Rhodanobacteraceae bacterium]|nr:hypothetical protein [Rhodanobacteraceae bacterium]
MTQPLNRRTQFGLQALAVLLLLAGAACCAVVGFEPGWMLLLGVLLALGGLALQAFALSRAVEGRRTVNRRYAREFAWAMGSYIVIVAVIWPQVDHVHSLALKILIGLLPIVPTAFVARAIVRRIRDGDELEQRVQLEAAAVAGLVVGLLTFSAGFLQLAGVVPVFGGALLLVWPLMCLVWGLALAFAHRRYRA